MNLILLTSEFPFNHGESFLEDEIEVLAKEFEKIIVISNTSKNNFSRKVPHNVEVINCYQDENKLIKLISCLRSKLFYHEIINNWRKILFNPNLIKDIIYFLSKSIILSEQIIKWIENCNLDKKKTVLYSYWLDEKAIAICLLSNKFKFYKTVSRAHGYDLYEDRKKHNYQPFRFFLKKTIREIYFISNHGKEYFRQLYGESSNSKYNVSNLGTNEIQRIKNTETNRNIIKFVTISSLIDFKQVHLIPKILSMIKQSNIEWTVFGDGQMMGELKKQISTFIPHITVHLYGQISNNELRAILKTNCFDYGLHLSLYEGIPVSFMEMFSVSIPIISLSSGAVNEIINESNGLLLNRNLNSSEIASCINTFLENNKKKHEQLSKNAFFTWETQYNSEINYHNFAIMLKN